MWTPETAQIGMHNAVMAYTDQFHQKTTKTLKFILNVTEDLPPTFNGQLTNISVKEGFTYAYVLPKPIDLENEEITLAFEGIDGYSVLPSWIIYNDTSDPTLIVEAR
mmetsp:Transcript_7071/g.8020  ORF Transcript_7071/g.8020 Transcript_7071/m.8020 type:complete len:107 (+) Transcript_7071:234-554(+)